MSCATCLQSKPIPRCLDSLIIGEVTADTDVIVKLKTFFGRTETFETTSDGSGTVTIDLSQTELAGGVYRLSIFAADDPVNELTITVGAETTECIEFMVVDGDAVTATITEKE